MVPRYLGSRIHRTWISVLGGQKVFGQWTKQMLLLLIETGPVGGELEKCGEFCFKDVKFGTSPVCRC